MKKHNFSNFLKSKSFYALLSVGALAILVIAVVGVYQASNNRKDLAEIDEPISEVVDEDDSRKKPEPDNDNKPSSSVANKNGSDGRADVVQKETDNTNDNHTGRREPTTDEELLEFDEYNNSNDLVDSNEGNQETEEVSQVMSPTTLHFNHEADKLIWPVAGNVIRKYSMDSLVHYSTLEQWKVSSAMLISAEEGEEVVCGVDGIITAIEDNEETGLTLTTSIGDGYALEYGQLENLTVEEGDSVEKGQIIGNISKPTRYNLVEGPSLHFKLTKGEDTLDPMLSLE